MRILISFIVLLFDKLKFVIFLLLIVFLLSDSQKSIVSVFNAYKLNLSNDYIQKSDFEKLIEAQERIKTLKYVNEHTDPNAIFLLFRDAEFLLYTNRKFIRHLDPILLDVYKSKNDQALYEHIADLNISYMYVPSYTSAIRSNTNFLSFINNPKYTQLVADNSGYRIYKINTKKVHADLSLSKIIVPKANLPFYKSIDNYSIYQTRFYTPRIDIDINTTYLIKSVFSGNGILRIAANESDQNGTEFSSRKITTHSVNEEDNETMINTIIYTPSKRAKQVKFVYIPSKTANVNILKTSIYIYQEEEVETQPEFFSFQNEIDAHSNNRIKVKPNTEYYIKSDVTGDGLLTLYALEYDSSNNYINTVYLNSVMCGDKLKHFSAIYIPSNKTKYFQLFYRKKGKMQFNVYNHSIYDITKKDINATQ